MRHALIGTAALVAFASATYACGSDSDPPANGGTTSSSSSSSSGTQSSSSSSSSSSGDTSSSSSSSGSSGNGLDAAPPVVADSGTVIIDDAGTGIPDGGGPIDASDPSVFDGAAGTQCLAGSVQEAEPNDTEAQANVMPSQTGSFCGRIQPGNDVDVLKFTMPIDTSEFQIGLQNTGANYRLEGKVGTETFVLAGADAGASFPFRPGETYTFTSTAQAPSDYILGFTVKQVTSSVCKTGSIKEAPEPNDAIQTPLPSETSSFCGTINTVTDADFATFTIPTGKNSLRLAFQSTTGGQGSFKIEGTVDGQTFTIPRGTGPEVPFVQGKPYVLKLTSTVPNNSYVIDVELGP